MKLSQKMKQAWAKSNKPNMIALEQRMLFDGVVATPVAATKPTPTAQPEANVLLNLTKGVMTPALSSEVNQVVFVDTRSGALPVFDQAPSSSVDVVWVNADADGLQQVTNYLASHTNISVLALAGEVDANGQTWLGSSLLDSNTLAQHSDQLAQWHSGLAANAKIDLVQADSTVDLTDASNTLQGITGVDASTTDLSVDQNPTWHLGIANPGLQAGSITELIFVDSQACNNIQFADLSKPGVEVIMLNPTEDGLSQIATITQGYADLTAIHIVASATSSGLGLGSAKYSSLDLSARSADILQISQMVSSNGVVDFYATDTNAFQADLHFVDKVATYSASGVLEAQRLVAADPSLDAGKTEVIFIDSNLDNWQQLASSVKPGLEVVLVNGWGDGLQEVADYLGGRTNIDAIHIVSHGSQGELFFGSLDATSGNIQNYSNDLASIGATLSSGGDILLYGCFIGEGLAGQAFLDQIASASGANVAASTDITGPVSLSGDWILEASSGTILASTAFNSALVQSYQYELGGSYTVTTGTNVDTAGAITGLVGAGKTIQFDPINISAATATAQLIIKAYDVDYGLLQSNGTPYAVGNANSEWDGVYIQKSGSATWQFVGYLTGTNNTWSTSTLDVTTYVKAQGSGSYIVRVIPDDNGTQTQSNNGGRWVVGVSSMQMLVDGGSGTNTLTSIAETGQVVTSNVTVASTGTYTVEYNLINASGQDIAALTKTVPITASTSTAVGGSLVLNTNFYGSGSTWSNVPSGSYTLQVTLLDANGTVQASSSLPYTVIAAASVPVSGVTALVTGLDAGSWTTTTASDLMHTATSNTTPMIVGALSNIASALATSYVDVYADGVYVGTTGVAPNSKTWTMQFGASSNAVGQTTAALSIGNHVFSAVYSTTASASVSATYTAGGSAATLDSSMSIVGTTVPFKAYVSLNSYLEVVGTGNSTSPQYYDALTVASLPSTLIQSYNKQGVLTISVKSGQTASVADFKTALDSVTFSSTVADPTNAGALPSRSISWQLAFGSSSTTYSAIKTTSLNVLASSTALKLNTLSYSSGVVVTPSTPSVTDYTNSGSISIAGASGESMSIVTSRSSISSATVSLTSGYNAGEDTLSFVNNSSSVFGNITGSYSAGVLTLGSAGSTASKAQWIAALEAITYTNSNTSNTRAQVNRTISYVISDGIATSSPVTSTIVVSNTAVSTNQAQILNAGNYIPAVSGTTYVINPNLIVTAPSGATFSKVVITDASGSASNTLAFANTALVTGSGGISGTALTLTSATALSAAQWQTALRTVTFYRSSSTTRDRLVTFQFFSSNTPVSNLAATSMQFSSSSGSGAATTKTTTTYTAANAPADSLNVGGSGYVSQSTNYSASAPTYSLLIDAPSQITPSIVAIDGTNALTTTADRSPTLSGTAAPGVSLQISLAGSTLGYVTTNLDGTWSYSLLGVQSLPDGAYTFTAKDTVNLITTTYALTVASPLPTISVLNIHISVDGGSSTADFVTSTAAQTISAKLSASLPTGSFLQASLDSGVTWTDVTSGVTGGVNVSFSGTLLAGYVDSNFDKRTIQLRVGNASGYGPVASQDYLLINSMSTPVSITNTAYYSSSQPTVIGTADPNSIVTVSYVLASGGTPATATVQPDLNGNWTFTVPTSLTNGVYNFTATEQDPVSGASGTVLNNTRSITVDTTLGYITGSIHLSSDTGSSATDNITDVASQTISATLSKVLGINQKLYGSLDGGSTWSDISAKVSGTVVSWTGATLAVGANAIELQIQDTSTNAKGALASLAYVLDTTAPVFAHGFLNPTNNTITLSFTEAGSGFDKTIIPAASTFTLVDTTGAALTVTGVQITDANTVVLAFTGATMTALDSITVTYTQPTSGSALTDIAGNKVLTFDPPVTNPITVLAVADTVSALEAGGISNAVVGLDPTGNVLGNDSGSSIAVTGAMSGGTYTAGTAVIAGSTSQSSPTPITGTYGSLFIGADGSYIYQVNNANTTVNALNVGGTLTDTFSYQITDASGNTSSSTLIATINGANDAPVVVAGTGPTYTERSSAVALSGITISDVDSANLAGTVVSISAGLNTGDSLSFTNTTHITGSYNSSTGVLTLTGSDTVANYQAALRSITFSSASHDPTVSSATRTISIQANDGSASNNLSSVVTETITIQPVNDAPTLSTTALAPSFGAGSAAVSVFTGTSISTIEAGQTIKALTFTVSGIAAADTSNEIVGVDGSNINIGSSSSGTTTTNGLSYHVSYSGGTATVALSGGSLSASAAQVLIDGITYRDTKPSPTAGNRVVTLTLVQDSGGTTNGGIDTTTLTNASTISVSSAAPPAETVSILSMTHDTGASSTDFITNDRVDSRTVSGTISASLQANEVVQASFDGGSTWVNATVSGSTNWTVTDSGSHSGSWTIKARVFNSSTSLASTVSTQAVTYIGSLIAPMVGLTTDSTDGVIGDNTDSISNNAALTISSAGAGVTRVFAVDGGSSSSTYTAPSTNGSHTVVVTDTDLAGNTANTSYTFTLDKQAPVISAATVSGSTLVLSYIETGAGLSSVTPDFADFSVTAGSGGAPIGISNVLVDTVNNKIILTLDSALVSTDSNIKVSYVAGANPTQDIAGNQSANLTNLTVTNQSPQQAPTLSVTTSTPTFIEGGSAAYLFGSASVSTIEAGQTLTRLDMTINNVSNSSAEQLIIDGSTINLVSGTGTTTSNSLAYTVSVSAGLATVSLTKVGGIDSTTMASVVNGIQYQDITNDPTAGNRVVTLTRIDDSGSSTSPNANSSSLSLASTVTVVPVNNAPTLTATGLNSPFGAQGAAVSVFTGTSISTVEFGQTIQSLTFTVSGVSDTSNEVVGVDGSTISIGSSSSGTTTTHGLAYSVTYSGGTATVSLSGGALSATDAQALINGITYRDTYSSPTTGSRVFTLTQIQDSGGTANSGVDTITLSTGSTISVSSATPPAETLTIASMSNDSGTAGDFITNDGTSGRTVSGTLSASLGSNEVVQVSFDGGSTWNVASTTSTNWTITDSGVHNADWLIAARVYNTSTHLASLVATQAVTFDNVAPATPTVALTSDTTDGVAGDNTDTKTNSAALTVSSLASGVTRNYTVDGNSIGSTYTAPNADGTHTVVVTDTDVAGNAATASTTFTFDNTAPAISTAAVNGSTLVLSYTEAGVGFSTVTPASTDFSVSVGGVVSAPSSVVVDATAHTVTLTLANAVLNTDTVLVSYTPGVNKIEDIAGNLAIALTGRAVTNNTPAAPAETLTIASMSNDSGTAGDFITNDGTSGRTVSGTLSASLGSN
ncbi:DUF4347 domain-containing protein, partial [Polynucleobacter sp. AP-RePozz3-80-G7]|uniref:DUF4347 domain-containing protein n=1 Tax=Polynucleobacter sp. AP-RePozz3-80-G7 TaxID=2689105 RepID=UPI001C0D2C8A